jgi:hypothetical protein
VDKIFTFGDGYATGHLWPEWPQILATLVPEYTVVNTAGIGAGAEYLVHKLVQQVDAMRDSHVIFQWPVADRFDKVVEDPRWSDIIKNDPVYHFNTVADDLHIWWLSSASSQKEIRTYHEFFVQAEQQQMRVRWIIRQASNGDAWIYQISVLHANSSAVDAKTLLSKEEYANFFNEFYPE